MSNGGPLNLEAGDGVIVEEVFGEQGAVNRAGRVVAPREPFLDQAIAVDRNAPLILGIGSRSWSFLSYLQPSIESYRNLNRAALSLTALSPGEAGVIRVMNVKENEEQAEALHEAAPAVRLAVAKMRRAARASC